PAVASYVAPLGRGGAFAAEVTQRIREKLFVAAPGKRPKVTNYNGLSPMGAWLRVVAIREALSVTRSEKNASADPRDTEGARATLASSDPELDYIKARHLHEFRAAFHAALEALTVDEKTLLRLHYLDGLTIDELTKLFAGHRSTIARRIVRCRET